MDYLQTLEFRMAALQRKVRLLQDLRSYVDASGHEELALFGEELKSVPTASGASLGAVLAAVLDGSSVPTASGASAAPEGPPPFQALSPEPAPGLQPEPKAGPTDGIRADPVPPDDGTRSAPAAEAPGEAAASSLDSIEISMKAIPPGAFLMGSETDETEKPQHKVALRAFRLCDHLVTNKEYSLFLSAHPEWSKDRAPEDWRDENYLFAWGESGYPEGKDDHPVAFVSYYAAQAFASWAGKRLPTEAEWEYGARGGLVGKKFPGGDQMNDKLANLAKQYRGTTPVKKFEPNGYGLYDMAGNLFEWTADWYGPYSSGEAQDPVGPSDGEYKVVRGGSWMSGAAALRVSARVDMEAQTCAQVGIRLADDQRA